MIKCGNCGTENRQGAKFCNNCGTHFVIALSTTCHEIANPICACGNAPILKGKGKCSKCWARSMMGVRR